MNSKFLKKFESGVTKSNNIIAFIGSLLIFPMMIIIVLEVFIRYTFISNWNVAFDVSWVCFVVFSFIGAGYALANNIHIKVDIFYKKLKKRGKIIANIIGYPLLFILPAISLAYSFYVLTLDAWIYEISGFWTPLEYPLWPMRLAVFIGLSLMTLQVFVKLLETIREIKGDKKL